MDSIDDELLAAMEISGIVPNSIDQQHRLDALLGEGLCYCEERSTPFPWQATPGPVYRLSIAGKAWLETRRGGRLKESE